MLRRAAESAMRCILRAVTSGLVHCLGHPLGRMVGKRTPLRYDLDRVFRACREHGVAVELNAQPERVDLPPEACRRAREAGLQVSIATDAHGPEEFRFMELGVGIARRGWLRRGDTVNALGW